MDVTTTTVEIGGSTSNNQLFLVTFKDLSYADLRPDDKPQIQL